MFLNKLEKNPSPLICLILKKFDFNLSQFIQLPIKYGLLFLVTLAIIFFDLVFFYKINNKFPLYIIIHINSFFKNSLELNNVKKFIKLFLLLISYKINKIQNIPQRLLEISINSINICYYFIVFIYLKNIHRYISNPK